MEKSYDSAEFLIISIQFYSSRQYNEVVLDASPITVLRWIKERGFGVKHVGSEVIIPKWKVGLVMAQIKRRTGKQSTRTTIVSSD